MAHIKEFEHLKIQLHAIKLATNDFADESCIGKGGFGKVYKGEIADSNGKKTIVALKRLDRAFGQGDPEFWKEIMMLSLYTHRNIVSLLGYCDDCGEKILVYEYSPKRSLDMYLKSSELTWVRRLNICIGAAHGLAYLHSAVGTQQRVLHRDIKSSNILLDNNWDAKIADFGLSKFGPANQKFTFLFSNAVGTYGYCDPLYVETGLLTKESDVYSFGVVLFEVLCGRLCIDNNDRHRPLTGLARRSYEQNTINEIVYFNIKDEVNTNSLKKFATIAYQCLKREREERPLMIDVVRELENALQCQTLSHRPSHTLLFPPRSRAGILNVKVLKAIYVRRRNIFAACNPYVMLGLTHVNLLSAKNTTVKHKKTYPIWNEEFTLYVENFDVQSLLIWVMSAQSVEKHDNLGRAKIPLKDLTREYPKTHNLVVCTKYSYFHVCNLELETVYTPLTFDQALTNNEYVSSVPKAPVGTPEGGGSLLVIIHEANYLRGLHHTNPYVSLLFRGELRKTKSIKNNCFPVWKEEFTFMLEQPPQDETLRLEVISSPCTRLFFREESLGYIDINVFDVVYNKRIIRTYTIRNDGELDVELQWRTSY